MALGVSALAVHGLMEGAFDPEHRYRLNSLHLVVPDGTGILWGLNLLHKTGLAERVRGPGLMLRTCAAAAEHDYGLRAIREEIARRADRSDTFAAGIATYQARLRGLFRAIADGEATLGLPPYNGGLFDPARAAILEHADLSDAQLAPILDRLSRLDGETGRRWINYRDLSVQQLGSIYEGLLEYELVADATSVRVADDDEGRRASGSFYTPEVLVQLILERAMGPLVAERLATFEARAAALRVDTRSKAERLAALQDLDPATRLLDIKVCDPAMGSGHFLVSLVD